MKLDGTPLVGLKVPKKKMYLKKNPTAIYLNRNHDLITQDNALELM